MRGAVRTAGAWALLTLQAPAAAQDRPVPGPAHPGAFQQEVAYRIEAVLDEDAQALVGRARVRYRNASPDTLGEFFLHLHLNAFRPGSAWALRDLEHGITTFQELGPGEHGYERITRMEVDGSPVAVTFPYAPDSTVARLALPRPLPPGGMLTLDYDWEARPSSVPRRQGRRGRQWDLAQWYPRVTVYDELGWRDHPLYRAGEFYGEFAAYDVTLDVAEDQVLGATGVPVEGDPGWQGAAALGTGPVDYQRDWYGPEAEAVCVVEEQGGGTGRCFTPEAGTPPPLSLGLLDGGPVPGRKRVRWYADHVHHFAWSTSPDYVYEQGRWEDVTIHVLYRPGDEATWGGGIAVRRTATALEWLDEVFGDYPYPQVTNLHRLEGGGTEFPMLIMDGSASLGLILHEVGHIYAHGILGNNEWYEGWLDEGLSSFQTDWYYELHGEGRSVWTPAIATVLQLELLGKTAPVVLPAEDYAGQAVYSQMVYTKGSLVFYMLREMVGEATFRRILRTWYERYRFRHVDSGSFQRVAEEVSGLDLDWFFAQWLHGTGTVDYGLVDVDVEPAGTTGGRGSTPVPHVPSRALEGGPGAPSPAGAVGPERAGWATRLTLEREGSLLMPVPVRLAGEGQVKDTVLPGTALRSTHRVLTTFRPRTVELDPDGQILDWNPRNDVWRAGPLRGTHSFGLDHPLEPLPVALDRVPVRLFPLAWTNDPAGPVAGVQLRTATLGFLGDGLVRLGLPGLEGGDRGSLYLRIRNPLVGGRPRIGTTLEAFAGEGRLFGRLSAERDVSPLPLGGTRRAVRLEATVYGLTDTVWAIPGRWSRNEHLGGEAGLGGRVAGVGPGGRVSLDLAASAGATTDDVRYVRGALTAEGTWPLEVPATPWGDWLLSLRWIAGGVLGTGGQEDGGWGWGGAPVERRFFVAGGDPLESLQDPWARSPGALLRNEAFVPGGGELRGFGRAVSVGRFTALGATVRMPPVGWRGIEAGVLAFGGALLAPEVYHAASGRRAEIVEEGISPLYHAGVGVEAGLTGSPLRVRVDLPFLVSEPNLDNAVVDEPLGVRITVELPRY